MKNKQNVPQPVAVARKKLAALQAALLELKQRPERIIAQIKGRQVRPEDDLRSQIARAKKEYEALSAPLARAKREHEALISRPRR
jgi:Tfp pilus assembly protein PilE